MSTIEEKYRELTGIDINEQKLLWDERGKGYWGEFLLFKELFTDRYLPGGFKLLMNLQVPISDKDDTTEVDLLLMHETGLYVFEVKHYKGTIYGKVGDQKWTQYFRTESNQIFRNPMEQNQYHINALKKIYPHIPIYSFIVFTNEECDLRVECNSPNITVCMLKNTISCLNSIVSARNHVMDMEQVDEIFGFLKKYAPIEQKETVVTERQIPFVDYLGKLIEEQEIALKRNKDNYIREINKDKKKVLYTKIVAAIICVFTILGFIIMSVVNREFYEYQVTKIENECTEEVEKARKELENFTQKFERVEEFNNGEIVLCNDLIEVTDIALENSKDVVDTVNFSCKLNWAGEVYGIHLLRDTKYIVILQDGSAKEYDLFGTNFLYKTTERIGKGRYETFEIPTCEFYGIDVDDIAYIKLVDVGIWKDGVNWGSDILMGYEIELYCK